MRIATEMVGRRRKESSMLWSWSLTCSWIVMDLMVMIICLSGFLKVQIMVGGCVCVFLPRAWFKL